MKQFPNIRAIAAINVVLLLLIISIVFSHQSAASSLPVTSMSDGAQQVAAPAVTVPIPAWSLAAAEAAQCPIISSLQTTSIASSMAAVPQSVEVAAQSEQLSPSDPQSFSGVYTLAQLNSAGLNPGALEGNDSLSAQYMLVVSHGNWPLTPLERSPDLNNSTDNQSSSNQSITWQYKILDPKTGAVVGGDYITNTTTCG